jgi:hypothetical protein
MRENFVICCDKQAASDGLRLKKFYMVIIEKLLGKLAGVEKFRDGFLILKKSFLTFK